MKPPDRVKYCHLPIAAVPSGHFNTSIVETWADEARSTLPQMPCGEVATGETGLRLRSGCVVKGQRPTFGHDGGQPGEPAPCIIYPIHGPAEGIDVTDALIDAISRELWKIQGGNEPINRLEAEMHVKRLMQHRRNDE